MGEAVLAETRNPEIIYSGTLWASFNTGFWPGGHDHYFYLQPGSNSYRMRRFMPENLSVDSVWNMMARKGHRVALIDLPKTCLDHLPETLQVSFWGEHEVLSPLRCWPSSFEKEVRQIAGTDPVGACDLVRQRPKELRRLRDRLIERTESRRDLALAVLERGPWDLFMLNFSEPHCAGHHLWAARDPGHPQYNPAFHAALGEDPLLDVYRAVDSSLGQIVETLGGEDFLMVFATHGIGPRYDAAPALDAVLRRLEGIDTPTTSGPIEEIRKIWYRLPGFFRSPFRRLIDRLYDDSRQKERAKRRCFTIPTTDNCGGIRINLRGREPEGQVEPGPDYRELCEWLKEELLALRNSATGEPVVRRILDGDGLFQGTFRDQFPDLVIEWNSEAPIPSVRSQAIGEIPVESCNPRTGDHRPKGFVLARHPGLKPHMLDEMVPLVDIAPTLAAYLKVELPGIEGKPIPGFLITDRLITST
jgi:predicted AlkP superfamily phosphohydrolase/phosphomutase